VAARKKPVVAEKTAVVRRPRRTREEGKALLLAAAKKLLESRSPDDVTIREIGAEAGVHHRFVMEWFGGKAALLREVHASRANTLASRIATTKDFQGAGSKRVLESIRREIDLVTWLLNNGETFDSIEDAFPSLRGGEDFLTNNFGLSGQDSEKSAQILGSILVADAILRPHMGIKYPLFDVLAHFIQAVRK
jgi:AcrR family transcriptional regulator